jgi:outer membrane biosynthesis protein TonB
MKPFNPAFRYEVARSFLWNGKQLQPGDPCPADMTERRQEQLYMQKRLRPASLQGAPVPPQAPAKAAKPAEAPKPPKKPKPAAQPPAPPQQANESEPPKQEGSAETKPAEGGNPPAGPRLHHAGFGRWHVVDADGKTLFEAPGKGAQAKADAQSELDRIVAQPAA